jgi:hypothetical protein
MRQLHHTQRVVSRYNRNVVSYHDPTMSRQILRAAVARLPAAYEMCIHYRWLRAMQSIEDVVRSSRHNPVMLFSDTGSSHLLRDIGRATNASNRVYADDARSFLEMTRCKRVMTHGSSFSVAAALVSDAHYDDILVYDARNCARTAPLLRARTMFFPLLTCGDSARSANTQEVVCSATVAHTIPRPPPPRSLAAARSVRTRRLPVLVHAARLVRTNLHESFAFFSECRLV